MKHYGLELFGETTKYSPKKPLKREPLHEQPKPERIQIKQHYAVIAALIAIIETTGSIEKEAITNAAKKLGMRPFEILDAMRHARLYWATFPDDDRICAFTPVIRKARSSKPTLDHAPHAEIKPQPGAKKLKKRPHIFTVQDEQRHQLMMYAQTISDLIDLRDSHGGTLPSGELQRASHNLNQTPVWIIEQMEHLQQYRATYGHEGDYTDANAFVPLPKGRPKGRTVAPEIQDVIEKAILTQTWPSLNEDGTTSKTNKLIGPKLAFGLITSLYDSPPSETTTWRIVNDLKQNNPSLYLSVSNDVSDVRNLMPSIDSKGKLKGAWQRLQLDIRLLPFHIDYNGIKCTPRLVVIEDSFSKYAPVWHLLPGKKYNSEEEIVSQDYTAQKIRELLAIAFVRVGGRVCSVYADGGTQFYKALRAYMKLLVSPDEPETALINRQRLRPRGGGGIENALGQKDAFAKTRLSSFDENQFRRSIAKVNTRNIPRYADIVQALDLYMHNVNTEAKPGTLSRKQVFEHASYAGLSLPSSENLAMFAMTTTTESRRPNPEGFQYNTKSYVPLAKDPAIYQELADATERAKKDKEYMVAVRICTIDTYEMVFFSCDEHQWYPAIDKDTDSMSYIQHTQLLKQVEGDLRRRGNEAGVFIHTLLKNRESPIILNGLRKTNRFETLQTAHDNIDAILAQPDRDVMPRTLGEHDTIPVQTERRPKNRRSTKKPSVQPTPLAQSVVSPQLGFAPSLDKAHDLLALWTDEGEE